MEEQLEALRRLIAQNKHIVFFGGAGVSTESGISDFRSEDGLYRQHYDVPPEVLLSHSYFIKHPKAFFHFYRDKMLVLDAQPNCAHLALAKLESKRKLSAVVTQNIDGLHQKAGSSTVYELHGSIWRNYCMNCGRFYPVKAIIDSTDIPYCSCGGIIKPDVVLYEEALDERVVRAAVDAIRKADLLIIGGTSLAVYPAAGLIRYYQGDQLVMINRSPTPADSEATLLINSSIGEVFKNISEE